MSIYTGLISYRSDLFQCISMPEIKPPGLPPVEIDRSIVLGYRPPAKRKIFGSKFIQNIIARIFMSAQNQRFYFIFIKISYSNRISIPVYYCAAICSFLHRVGNTAYGCTFARGLKIKQYHRSNDDKKYYR